MRGFESRTRAGHAAYPIRSDFNEVALGGGELCRCRATVAGPPLPADLVGDSVPAFHSTVKDVQGRLAASGR